jgi:two-component system response regulator HydG
MMALATESAPTEATCLIQGETGTGKELVARHIHANSARAQQRMVELNCSAIPDGLLESELFGHEKGAFTSADAQRIGLLAEADGGTLFLDEVGELSLPAQAKMLRALGTLDNQQVRPVGSNRVKRISVRIIAATNRDLRAAVSRERFRKDFYFRLAVVVVLVPALRERREDLPDLLSFYLQQNPVARSKSLTGVQCFTRGALKVLEGHSWPGNLRELENVVSFASIRAAGPQITRRDLPPDLTAPETLDHAFPTLAEVNRRHIITALERCGGNRTRAAALLGIHRNTLCQKLRALEGRNTATKETP